MKIQTPGLEEACCKHPAETQSQAGGGVSQLGLASGFFSLVTALEAVCGGEEF